MSRAISEADKSFLFTITGAAAQAVERARLTLTEFVNLERSQHLHHLSSALAAATTPATWPARRSPAGGGPWARSQPRAASPAAASARSRVWPSSGHPALLLPRPGAPGWQPSGSCFSFGRTDRHDRRPAAPRRPPTMSPEIVPGCMADLGQPVTIVTEPLVGSVGSLGVLSLAFVAPEPSEPEPPFLSTLAG
jgi:hypothetical protein